MNHTELSKKDIKDLELAIYLLEHPGLAAKITNFIGSPIEKGIKLLPKKWFDKVERVTTIALERAADAAIFSLSHSNKPKKANNNLHKVGVAITGGIGGMFGLSALAIELPVSTTIILRSIADIARSENLDILDEEIKLACLEVFALGGTSEKDDATESGYWMVRASIAKTISEASNLVTQKAGNEIANYLFKIISKIAKKFSVQITEKAAAQAIPAIGAIGGAAINTLFINHFQQMAKGHFIIKRLEQTYGKDLVELAYHEVLLAQLEQQIINDKPAILPNEIQKSSSE